MPSSDRYLHFENIDMGEPAISAQCSRCEREFAAAPRANERVDDVILRLRAEFNAHECQLKTFAEKSA